MAHAGTFTSPNRKAVKCSVRQIHVYQHAGLPAPALHHMALTQSVLHKVAWKPTSSTSAFSCLLTCFGKLVG
jgi:hypothetical protein